MTIVCMVCKKRMGTKPGQQGEESHDICRKCWKRDYPDLAPGPEAEAAWAELEKQGNQDAE